MDNQGETLKEAGAPSRFGRNAASRSRRRFLKGAGTAAAGAALAGAAAPVGAVEINAMGPTQEQMQAFLELPDAPIVMVNLLKFKPDGGQAEYAQYAAKVQELLAKVGAKSLFAGRADLCLVGDASWDMVALVEYPTPKALIQMASSPEYQAIHHHREAGLEGQVNYAVTQSGF